MCANWQNKIIEVHGPLKAYDGRAEIVVSNCVSLAAKERRFRNRQRLRCREKGKYSAGIFQSAETRVYNFRETADGDTADRSSAGPAVEAESPGPQ